MKKVTGDLIDLAKSGVFDVIVHGCNCQCAMGAGIAKAIKSEFPDRNKLGTISFALTQHRDHQILVVNAYTQFHWRGAGIKVDYEALKRCFTEIKQNFSGKRIGYPLVGAGLAGGDWNIISSIIESELEGEDHTLVNFKP